MFYLQIKKVMRNYTDLNFLMKNLSVNELRSDVKALLAQSNIDKTRIDNLTNDVRMLEEAVFNKKTRAHSSVYLPQHDPYFKPEEEYDVKKYLKTI